MTGPIASDPRPLIAHVVYRFDTGGLENGVVNLVNRMDPERFRHAVVALTEVTGFRSRVTRPDVVFEALHKPAGHGLRLYPRLWRLFRAWQPAILHTRNLAALEAQVPAWAAGVPVRIHGEHGRDVGDLDGSNRKYQWLRRAYAPFVHHYVALSRDLSDYLCGRVGIGAARVAQIYNGVDDERFAPAAGGRTPISGCPFGPGHWLVGTVGRMQAVKNQTLLARAFVRAIGQQPALHERMRLVLVGDGPQRVECMAILEAAGLAPLAWVPGERSDVADVMRGLDCFVLPSLAEGISNTILEAMASGLPVVATSVGGNAELVDDGRTGALVASGDEVGLADTLVRLARDPSMASALGSAGRRRVEAHFGLKAMVAAYQDLYEGLLDRRGAGAR